MSTNPPPPPNPPKKKGIAHVIEGAGVAVVLACFGLISRAYSQDELQDRKIVYSSGAGTLLMSVAVILSSTDKPSSFGVGCIAAGDANAYFNPNANTTDQCLKFASSPFTKPAIGYVTTYPHPLRFWLTRGHWWGAPTPLLVEGGSAHPASVLPDR